jgi:acyl dehydratase
MSAKTDNDAMRLEPGSVVAECRSETISREMLAQYAEASGDLNPLHLDPAFARKAGFPDVIAHGMLGMALLGRMLTQRFSAERLCNFSARFTGTVPVGEALLCRARVEAVELGTVLLALEAATSSGAIAITGQARVQTG